MQYDLVLRGGRVMDPSAGIDGVMDVGIRGGLIAAVGPELATDAATPVRDVRGNYVAPGLVDLHGHWYEGSAFGIDPDICLNYGVTTAADAGTTGFINFPDFRRHTVERARVRVLAFLNIACAGLPTTIVGELENLRYARPEETAEAIARHREVTVGVKLRDGFMTAGRGVEAAELAIAACEASGTRLMLHISKGARTSEVLPRLRAGDIVTHCFQGKGDGIFENGGGPLRREVREARARGVLFDVGHGMGSFRWETARRGFEEAFYPDTISTDLHRFSVEGYGADLPSMISKFLHLGMPLADAILKTTAAPARAMGHPELGTLRQGSAADVFVFGIEEGSFDFRDAHGTVVRAERRVRPVLTVRGGVAWEAGSYPVRLRELYACDREVFDPGYGEKESQKSKVL